MKKTKQTLKIPPIHTQELLDDLIERYFLLDKPSEEILHNVVAYYMRVKHPEIIFRTDAGGLRMPMGLAIKFRNQQNGRAYPDLFIAEPKSFNISKSEIMSFSGLYIELKKEGTDLFQKRDRLVFNKPHYKEQNDILNELRLKGYHAVFCIGLKETMDTIEKYLSV